MYTVKKFFISLVLTTFALIPFWAWLGLKHALNPVGFWQNLILVGAGTWILGGVQAFLLLILVIVLYSFWTEKETTTH